MARTNPSRGLWKQRRAQGRPAWLPLVLSVLAALLVTPVAAETPGAESSRSQSLLIADIETDRAMYQPGMPVAVTVHLVNHAKQTFDGTITVSLKERDRDAVPPQTQRVAGLAAEASALLTYTVQPPARDYRGYLLQVEARRGGSGSGSQAPLGTLADTAGSAVDVSSDWKRFPRYGYVSRFAPGTDSDAIVRRLNRYHMNGLQFYDANWKHHRPYSAAARWPNLANHTISRTVVMDMIRAAHARGMMAMNYNLWNGAYDNYWADGSGVAVAWGIFKHPLAPGQSYTPADQDSTPDGSAVFPAGWASDKLYLFNPADAAWRRYLFAQEQTLFAALPYDGWHIDTLGDPGARWDWKGNLVDMGASLAPFVNEACAALSRPVLLNTVGRWNEDEVARSASVDFLYSELWGETPRYQDIVQAVRKARLYSSKAIVFPAYMNTAYAHAHYGQSGFFFNEPSIRLVDATMLAAGAIHLELGDGDVMISNIYWPGPMLQMQPSLQAAAQDDYDFAVAYENLLRDGVAEAPDVHLSLTGTAVSTDGRAGTVWVMPKSKAGFLVAHLINLTGSTSDEWRDENASCPAPQTLTAIQVKMHVGGAPIKPGVSRLLWASPDRDHGASHLLAYTAGTDGSGPYITFTLPSLHYWDMVYLETTALSGHDYNINAFAQVEAEHDQDAQGLGVVDCSDRNGGMALGNAFGGRWAHYVHLDFGQGAVSVQARVATATGGAVELRRDSPAGPLLATINSAATGGWQTWKTLTAPVQGATGLHDVYAVFPGSPVNLNWFRFVPAAAERP